MNTRLVLSSLLLAAFAGNALADDPTVVNDHFVSTKTRAEVKAELKAFEASGRNPWSIAYQPLKYFHSDTSRQAVEKQYLASRDQVQALTGEDSGSFYLAQSGGATQAAPTLAAAGTPVHAQ